ncbi:MAG TPA: class I SAM-dependent methyltransferase [Sphingomicrobium sp.]|nr:class I SAM-dependent methyltransferase [Sphingomicrobium sp.]
MSAHEYNADFYTYIDAGSRRSARAVAALLLPEMRIDSLLDVGAGHGAWAAEWLTAGVADVLAVDGDYVRPAQLAIPAANFRAHDLGTPLHLERSFDLVQTLEVAEHLPADKAETFLDNLVAHGDVVLFSAAVPHQGGEHHVNEQPPEYWRAKLKARGYDVFDFVRPALAGRDDVMPWYRFNTYLYANAEGQKRLSAKILATKVADGRPLEIGGDLKWALRRAAVRLIPPALVKQIAMAKARLETAARR